MDKLMILLGRCKCGVHLTINEHRDYYEGPTERLEWYAGLECPPEIAPEIRGAILLSNNIVDLQFYPDTPIGSYHIVHNDLDAALDEALACLGLMANVKATSPQQLAAKPPSSVVGPCWPIC